MSLEVFYSLDALEDLTALKDWLESNAPKSAKAVLRAILETCDLLASMPDMGKVAKYKTKSRLRYITVKKKYLVFYSIEPKTLYVVRVLDGRQDIQRLLEDL